MSNLINQKKKNLNRKFDFKKNKCIAFYEMQEDEESTYRS